MSLYQPNVETIENVRQYCSLFDSNPNAIIVIDPDRDPVYQNTSFTQQFGNAYDEFLAIEEVKLNWDNHCQTVFSQDTDEFIMTKALGLNFEH